MSMDPMLWSPCHKTLIRAAHRTLLEPWPNVCALPASTLRAAATTNANLVQRKSLTAHPLQCCPCCRAKGPSSSSLIITHGLALCLLSYFTKYCIIDALFWLRNFFIKGQQLFWPSNIKTDFYALHTSIIASYFHLASVIIYLGSDRMFLILFLHYPYQWKIVTLPLTVQNNMELFHKCRSKSTSFTWMKSRSALCSMKEPFCQMCCVG